MKIQKTLRIIFPLLQTLAKNTDSKQKKSKPINWDAPSCCEGWFSIFTATLDWVRGQMEGLRRVWQAVTDSDNTFLSWYTHSLCVIHSVFWPFVANMECYTELCECWQQSYLWFFLQSDVHPLVARQSPLLHGMMPEVIIISKNLHRHKRGSTISSPAATGWPNNTLCSARYSCEHV